MKTAHKTYSFFSCLYFTVACTFDVCQFILIHYLLATPRYYFDIGISSISIAPRLSPTFADISVPFSVIVDSIIRA